MNSRARYVRATAAQADPSVPSAPDPTPTKEPDQTVTDMLSPPASAGEAKSINQVIRNCSTRPLNTMVVAWTELDVEQRPLPTAHLVIMSQACYFIAIIMS
jgi:hypothetical protein